MNVHYTEGYLLNPQHQVTVNLVGVGGTGSQMLGNMARINQALVALGHPGIHVMVWDGDIVSVANVGRQLFSPADIGINKAIVLVTRLNRFFGTNWEAMPEYFDCQRSANILITCVDSAEARLLLKSRLKINGSNDPLSQQFYWLDLGNLKKTGQVIIGTIKKIKQPKSKQYNCIDSLPDVVGFFPELRTIKDEDQGPSCSLAEALSKQDLFINSTLAQFGSNLIWKLFREGVIHHHGCFVNLETFSVNPIKIKSNDTRVPTKAAAGAGRKNAKPAKAILSGKGLGPKKRPTPTK